MPSIISLDLEWAKQVPGILKMVTVVINLICIGILVDHSLIHGTSKASTFFLPVTTGGFLLVDIFLILSYTMDGNYLKAPIQELTIAGLGVIFHLAAGSIAIRAYDYDSYNGAADTYGSFTIINAGLYAATFYSTATQTAGTEYEDPSLAVTQ